MFVAIIQSTVTSHIRFFGVSPDLTLLFVVSWVLLHGTREGTLIALVSGIVLDALSGAPFGLAMVSLTVVSGLAGLGETNVFRTAWFLPYVTISLATLIYDGLFLFLLQMGRHTVTWWPALWRVVLPSVIVNTLCMAIVYHSLRWLTGHSEGHVSSESVEWP